ncbi:MAG: protease modulator HflC [Deltaproteobacteria bacterium]|nr:protease modulator HflC [Deltaproteobacteria bacterium]
MRSKGPLIIIPVVILAFIIFGGFYTIDETEQVVLIQFGRVIGKPKTDPGLNFKIPFIQDANYFPKNLQEWDGDPGQIPTLDKTFIWVDTFARWKIVDPLKFFQTVTNMTGAQSRLDDIIDAAVRNLITSYPLIETVRKTNRELDTFELGLEEIGDKRPLGTVEVGREKIAKRIMEQAQPKMAQFGIQLVDVQIKRLNYVQAVQKSVFGRMIAERKQIAEKFRSEGRGEANKIEGDMEREMKLITSEAYKTAQEIMGEADAEATSTYAEAYGLDPDFYSFVKTLEIYRESLDEENTLVLSTDTELFKYLKSYTGEK